MTLFESNTSGAEFSACGKMRFRLWRIWDESKPKAMFIGLNPSTANASNDDPTIRCVKAHSKRWGYGGIYMLNLYPFITPYPAELKISEGDEENLRHLRECAELCQVIICAWGAFPIAKPAGQQIISMFPQVMAMKINADGSPHHPLYLPNKTIPIPYIC